ncbi:MAG TPA: signal peptidase II [Bacteroidetes bacterium]|nr:signal peptidase II [Bacteroidota bacterium]
MFSNKLFRTLIIIVLIATNIGCDQVSKSIVRESVEEEEWIEIWDDNLLLTNVENSGAFFGWLSDLPPVVKGVVLSFFPSLAILAILFTVFTRTNLSRGSVVGLSFVIGGGIGNIYDRIAYGSVTDFLHIDLGIFRTGIFNMADVSIMVGMGIVLVGAWWAGKGEQGAVLGE